MDVIILAEKMNTLCMSVEKNAIVAFVHSDTKRARFPVLHLVSKCVRMEEFWDQPASVCVQTNGYLAQFLIPTVRAFLQHAAIPRKKETLTMHVIVSATRANASRQKQ
jgi:hypothetical protein